MQRNKNIGIFTPFPSIIGGGEKYLFTLAEVFSQQGYKVNILSPFVYNIKNIEKNFNVVLPNTIYSHTKQSLFFLSSQKKFDYYFALSNHICPPTFGLGKLNILIIQFPFPLPSKKTGDKLQHLLTIPKLLTYQHILCYSEYAKKWIEKKLPKAITRKIKIHVISPAIDIEMFPSSMEKKNIILSVGRFFSSGHNKNHLFLIDAFKELQKYATGKDWELHLVGSTGKDIENKNYFEEVKKKVKGFPIIVHPDMSSANLSQLYKDSSILWHAAGYENNQEKTPERSEHFGIVVIEALAAGSIPVVVNAGGLPEIIKHKENGYLWSTKKELISNTLSLIRNKKLMKKMRQGGKKYLSTFSKNFFKDQILKLYP